MVVRGMGPGADSNCGRGSQLLSRKSYWGGGRGFEDETAVLLPVPEVPGKVMKGDMGLKCSRGMVEEGVGEMLVTGVATGVGKSGYCIDTASCGKCE